MIDLMAAFIVALFAFLSGLIIGAHIGYSAKGRFTKVAQKVDGPLRVVELKAALERCEDDYEVHLIGVDGMGGPTGVKILAKQTGRVLLASEVRGDLMDRDEVPDMFI